MRLNHGYWSEPECTWQRNSTNYQQNSHKWPGDSGVGEGAGGGGWVSVWGRGLGEGGGGGGYLDVSNVALVYFDWIFEALCKPRLAVVIFRQHRYFRKMLGVNGCQNIMEFRESLLGVSGVVDFTPVVFKNSKTECLFVWKDIFLLDDGILVFINFIAVSVCITGKWSETSVYIIHWNELSTLSKWLLKILSINVAEFSYPRWTNYQRNEWKGIH